MVNLGICYLWWLRFHFRRRISAFLFRIPFNRHPAKSPRFSKEFPLLSGADNYSQILSIHLRKYDYGYNRESRQWVFWQLERASHAPLPSVRSSIMKSGLQLFQFLRTSIKPCISEICFCSSGTCIFFGYAFITL